MLTDKILACAARQEAPSPAVRAEIATAVLDTFAVTLAGWFEPVSQAIRKTYPEVEAPDAGGPAADPERAALVWGTAAHALDFDDVHTTSVTHPSAVLVPALVAMTRAEPALRARLPAAFLTGLATNVALGEALGFHHYDRGWHATSTIGAVAAAAAVAHLIGLEERAFRSALSIGVSQAGGTQVNFGSMAKPLHAGLAAAAGVRAARLAANGLEAAYDAFGEKGFLDLYDGVPSNADGAGIELAAGPESLSRKLYPCCYMAHRPIAAALELRGKLDPAVLEDPDLRIEVLAPYGCTKALRVTVPESGLEAKFSGPYTVAAALLEGAVGLSAFEDEAVRHPALQALLRRVSMSEEPLVGPAPSGIDHGTVRLTAIRGNSLLASAEAAHYPGSPAWPASRAEILEKVEGCLAHHRLRGGREIGPDAFVRAVESELEADAAPLAVAG